MCVCVCEDGESSAVTGSIEVNTTTDWKWSLSSWGVSVAGGIAKGIKCRVKCASKANIAPLNRSMTHNPTHSSPIPSLTPFTLFQAAHTRCCCYISFARSLTLPGCVCVAAAFCPSVPLPLSSRLSAAPCVFPHGFVNGALSHAPDMLRAASE